LHMPASYQPGKKWPVVLAFHGWKETAGMMEGYTEMDAAEAIMVYPYGKDGAWAPAPYAKTTGTEDIQFARDIVDSLRATYAVDDDRIFATGMSNGGGFAAYLGCQMPMYLPPWRRSRQRTTNRSTSRARTSPWAV